MKINYLIIAGVCLLTGCQATGGLMKNSISFQIYDQLENQDVVYKNNWPECGNLTMTPDAVKKQKYITSYSNCKVAPEGFVPKQIVIEYAPWLTYEQQQKIPELRAKEIFIYKKAISRDTGNVVDELVGKDEEAIQYNKTVLTINEQAAIDKIPASAWKRIVLTPPTEVAKYKYQTPEGEGNPRHGKEINYVISLKPDGTYSIETKLYWTHPYQTKWN